MNCKEQKKSRKYLWRGSHTALERKEGSQVAAKDTTFQGKFYRAQTRECNLGYSYDQPVTLQVTAA